MDGLSAAASGIAVASLAIQLVDSVHEIRRFFRTLKDAPEELSRLLDLLENMELMLDTIGKLVEPDSDISPIVLKAIQTCEKALNKLGALIQKVKRDSSAQSRLKKSLSFFKLACKKEEVEEIERQLHRAVSNLNMVMTALNFHGVQWLRNGVLATNAAAAANQKGSKQQTVDNCSRKSKPAVHRRHQNHKTVYWGLLGSITTIVQSESEDLVAVEQSKDPYARDEWSWVFIPSFFSRCVEFKCASSLGSIERTLRTCPILPDDHQVWDMCYDGDVSSIHELFRTREVSPYAIDRCGTTLLHLATMYSHSEMCGLLLDMGVRTDVVNANGITARCFATPPRQACDRIESTYRLFTAANDDRDLAIFCPDYFDSLDDLSVENFGSRVEQWVTEENVNLFQPSPLEVVTGRLCNLSIDPTEYHKLKDIASYLIAKGAKFHELECWWEETCLIEAIILSAVHPFDSPMLGKRLLEMLAASNVDVAEYLAFERQHHPKELLNAHGYHKRWHRYRNSRAFKLEINEKHPFSISWDWWVDPKEEAFTVLQEFRHFGRAENCSDGQPEPAGWSSYWPFFYPDWTWGLGYWALLHEKALLKRVKQRSDRRWEKKMIKQAKMQGTYKKSKMPGTWIH